MRVAIKGNTYQVKDKLKALGGYWLPKERVWSVSEEFACFAQSLVDAADADALVKPEAPSPTEREPSKPRFCERCKGRHQPLADCVPV